MDEQLRTKIGIHPEHEVTFASGRREQRKGQDADIDIYEVHDQFGLLMARYEVVDSMSIYPPFTRSITHREL